VTKIKLDILLPMFNSEAFLLELLLSIERQTIQEFTLYIYDDHSGDNSLMIVRDFIESTSIKNVILLNSEPHNVGINKAVNKLFNASCGEYIMLCDHDDYWLPDRIEIFGNYISKLDIAICSKPLLLFSDLVVVDDILKTKHRSYFKYYHISPFRTKPAQLITQNVAPGCSIMINRALLNKCNFIPDTAVAPDHWLNLIATTFGHILFINASTILYRRHDNNISDSIAFDFNYVFTHLNRGIIKLRKRFYQNIAQIQELNMLFGNELPMQYKQLFSELVNFEHLSWLQKRKIIIRNKIFKCGWLRNIGTMLIL
jgi:glycosyltransferase involved in cell wall biosynthesis